MEKKNWDKAKEIIGNLYTEQALASRNSFGAIVNWILTHKRIPEEPWPSNLIEHFLYELSLMDSNNFKDSAGVGEREGRVFSEIVSKRHFYLSHGIGRSGDLFAIQPKAAGSSLISKLTCSMARDALNIFGLGKLPCLILPLATGMSLTMCLLVLRQERPNAKIVIWSRIDQKTCLKCIFTAGLEVFVLNLRLEGDKLITGELDNLLLNFQPSDILCVLSTTSCFAPRVPDDVVSISRFCQTHSIPHIINNAYGLQCSKICAQVREAVRIGRVDFIVQSTDKNFLVPVGGAIIASPNKILLEKLNTIYPGRASMSNILDLFITFLQMGSKKMLKMVKERKEKAIKFKENLQKLAELHGERVLESKENTISFAITCNDEEIGSKLFVRRVSGCRFIGQKEKEVCGIRFKNYGSSFDGYPYNYFTAACALGLTDEEIERFIGRLSQLLKPVNLS